LNKQELISNVASKTKVSKTQVMNITDALFDTIEGSLKKGQKVQLVGFGSWSKVRRKARTGRNPQTGKSINIAARNVAKFSMGQRLYDTLN
jgi:DNA-binding protein HU-beta